MSNYHLNSRSVAENMAPPPTPLANSLTQGISSEIRAGNELECGNNPQPVTTLVSGFLYLVDLVPDTSAGRLVELQASAPYSGQTTLVMSYRATSPEEQANQMLGEFATVSTDLRDYRAIVKFGTGNASHDVECDIVEGQVMTLPASNVNVTLYSSHFNRRGGLQGRQIPLKSQAHLASWAGPTSATCTDRVNAPMQAELDLLNPPTIEEWLTALWEAICDEQYLLSVEPEA